VVRKSEFTLFTVTTAITYWQANIFCTCMLSTMEERAEEAKDVIQKLHGFAAEGTGKRRKLILSLDGD
jgi:hypothetical protein